MSIEALYQNGASGFYGIRQTSANKPSGFAPIENPGGMRLYKDAEFSWANPYGDASAWLPEDYDASDPYFIVKGTDADGKDFEARVRIKDIGPRDASAVEMTALSGFLSKTGKIKGDGFNYLNLPYAPNADGTPNAANSFFDKTDYISLTEAYKKSQMELLNYSAYQQISRDLYHLEHFIDYVK